jgi:hypothetical protein
MTGCPSIWRRALRTRWTSGRRELLHLLTDLRWKSEAAFRQLSVGLTNSRDSAQYSAMCGWTSNLRVQRRPSRSRAPARASVPRQFLMCVSEPGVGMSVASVPRREPASSSMAARRLRATLLATATRAALRAQQACSRGRTQGNWRAARGRSRKRGRQEGIHAPAPVLPRVRLASCLFQALDWSTCAASRAGR